MVQRLLDLNKLITIKTAIQHLLNEGFEFAIYAHPNSNNIYCIISNGESNKSEGFILHAFSEEKKHLISADFNFKNEEIIEALNLKNKNLKQKVNHSIPLSQSKENFEKYVKLIVEKCQNKEIEKCVAARTIQCKIENENIPEIFIQLCQNYPHAFVSFTVSPFGIWLGASPEILVKEIEANQYETMSLAGTKRVDENRDWTNKEIEEQAIVTHYIKNKLSDFADSFSSSEPVTHQAGYLHHIKTSITFQSKNTFLEIAKQLHPTPAVCGLPLEKSLKIIEKNETNRSIYAGFIGTNLKNDSKLYVNLRCMQIIENTAILYVGAGITAKSIAESEWQETENKAQTLKKYLS